MAFTPLTYQGEIPTSDSLNRALVQLQTQIDTLTAGGGTGTVTSVSVVTANGMSGTVATATTTPAITLVVGAINLATATGLPEAGLSLTNITTNNVSITKHGFAPILPNDATKYLDGTGAYTVPAGSGGGITIGTTTITGGTTTRLLYDAAGVVGEITGATSNGTALTLVAPVLGTPASGTLTNCTGLPAAGVVGTAAILGANSFTGVQTITPAANAEGIVGASATHTLSSPFLDIAQTWNAGGVTFTGIKLNITSTASASGSQFVDFQLAGVSVFQVTKGGLINLTQASNGLVLYASGQVIGGNRAALWQESGGGANLFFASGSLIKFTGTNDAGTTVDAGLGRNAGGIIEINNGTAGTFRDLRVRSPIMTGSSASTAAAGEIALSGGTQSTVGAAGGASALPGTPTGYIKINVAGTAMVVPYYAAA